MRSRLFCAVLLLTLSGTGINSPAASSAQKENTPKVVWHSVSDWDIEGRAWPVDELDSPYHRLPSKAEGIVRDKVWNLSQTGSAMACRFNTDATEVTIKYTFGDKALALPHITATGVSGVDPYALDSSGHWKWVSCSKSSGTEVTHTISGIDPGMRTSMAYFPLRNSLFDISLGVPRGAKFQPVAPRSEKPTVFYGTSITHGACATRPGMPHVAILGRRLNLPVVNLGFAGNGTMDPEVGASLTELDAAVYVIDCLPNMNGDQVAKKTEPLVKPLRQARPDTPVVLVEDRSFSNSWLFKGRRDHHEKIRSALVRAYDNLVSSGVKTPYYLEGEDLLGDDIEATAGGSHPSDLGFLRQIKAFEPLLKQAIGLN